MASKMNILILKLCTCPQIEKNELFRLPLTVAYNNKWKLLEIKINGT